MAFFKNHSAKSNLLLIGLCIFYFGCTNIDRTECKKTHWPTQGFEDGAEGRTSRISMFLAKCSPYKVNIDSNAYLESYEKGLDKFCSEESAFSRGFQGLSPEAVCANKKKYKISYEMGTQKYCAKDSGIQDAQNGKEANLFCNSKKSDYFLGYQIGLKQFCTPENGYKHGYEGKPKSTVCVDEFKMKYSQGYKTGRLDFLKKDIERIQNNIKLSEKELRLVKDRYTEQLSAAYEMPSSSEDPEIADKKLKIDTEIKLLKEKKSRLEQDIFDQLKKINDNNAEIGKLSQS